MYKLIAIDLDGTMLNTYGEVTENTKTELKKIIQKGIEVVIASGRTIDSIKVIANEIGGQNYIIAGNGAIVHDIKNQKNIYEKYLSKEKALEIIKICQENSITFSVYTEKTIIADKLKYNILYYYKENMKKVDSKKTNITIVENIYEFVKNMENDNIMRIMICDETKSVFSSIIRKMHNISGLEISDVSHMSKKTIKSGSSEITLEYYYTEILEENVDKWYALEFLLDKLNIDKKDMIAIGDNVNDIKMIQNAGKGVAMGGSNPKVIEVADCVTDDSNHEGVANFIKTIEI